MRSVTFTKWKTCSQGQQTVLDRSRLRVLLRRAVKQNSQTRYTVTRSIAAQARLRRVWNGIFAAGDGRAKRDLHGSPKRFHLPQSERLPKAKKGRGTR